VCDQPTCLLDGLCADCLAREADLLDLDPDLPIPFVLTSRALALLDGVPYDADPELTDATDGAPFRPNYHHSHTCPRCGYHAYHQADADCAAREGGEHFGGCPDLGLCDTCGHPVNEHDTQDRVRRCGGCPDWRCQTPAADPDVSQVDSDATTAVRGSQAPHGASGEAACPRCGKVYGVVFDGERTRCFGCHRHWVPTPPAPIVA
jgi:hypothetical protein